jgi:bifunctional DNase/RNase
MQGEISEARIVDLKEDVYFADVIIQPLAAGSEIASLDARASDALALAIRAKAPIRASEDVMERAGIILPAHVESDDDDETESINPVTDEELAKLTAFRDLVEGLNLDDLGDLSES